MPISRILLLSAAVCAMSSVAPARDEPLLQRQLKDAGLGSHWIYDDVEQAMSLARGKGRPLLVLFR